MNLLCLDTCIEDGSVVLVKEKSFFFEKKWTRSFTCDPSSFLILEIKKLFQEANCALQELDGIVVTQGPGSFTGIRIGLSAAQGLSFALQKPIASLSLIEIWQNYARATHPQTVIWTLINTYGSQWVTHLYDPTSSSQGIYEAMTPEEIYKRVFHLTYAQTSFLCVGWKITSLLRDLQCVPPFLDLSTERKDGINISGARLLAEHCLRHSIEWKKNGQIVPLYIKTPYFSPLNDVSHEQQNEI